MTPIEVKEHRVRLEMQRVEIIQFLTSLDQELRSLHPDVPQDSADCSVTNLSQEFHFAQASQRRLLLRRIEVAIQRIDEGSFGTCLGCGEPISRRRLEAVPWTQNCLHCQQLIERSADASSKQATSMQTE